MQTTTTALLGFLRHVADSGCKPKTIETYDKRITLTLRHISAESLRDLTPNRIKQWHREALQSGMSPVTINGRLQSIRAFCRWLVDQGLLEDDPTAGLRRLRVPQFMGEKTMKRSDAAKLLAEAIARAGRGDVRDLAVVSLLLDSGCRVGELCSITLDRLNLPDYSAIVDGKTGPRLISYTPRTGQAIKLWLSNRPKTDSAMLFVAPRGRYKGIALSENATYLLLKRLAKAADITGRFNPHSIRHMVGQSFTDEYNVALAQQKLGHSNPLTTIMFYAHQDRKRVQTATDNLSLWND